MSEQATLDTLGMWEAVTSLPEQLTGALQVAGEAFGDAAAFGAGVGAGADTSANAFRAVAAFGLGTGGTACAAAAALTAPDLPVPFWVGGGSAVPAFVGPDTLVLAVSPSGETAETLVAAEKAVERGATVVAVGGDAGGALARLAEHAGLPWCPGGAAPTPARAALGATTVALLVALARAGLRPDCGAAVTAASAALARRRDTLVAPGAAPAELARRLGRTIPLIYGATAVAALAAGWWKAQVNLNAKAPAFAAAVPEVTHDELAGWGQGGDVTRQTMSLVLLRHAGEGPRAAGLFDAVRAATDEVMADIFEVHGQGNDELSRFFDLTLFGELVSLHLAAREGIDPGPVPTVDEAQAATALG